MTVLKIYVIYASVKYLQINSPTWTSQSDISNYPEDISTWT